MSTQPKKLSESFRLQIRQKQITQLFQTNRAHLLSLQSQPPLSLSPMPPLSSLPTSTISSLQLCLNTPKSRQNWLQELSLKMSGFPNKDWQEYLGLLYYGLRYFQEEFQGWVRGGIVKGICDVLREEYLDLGLYRLAANILTDVLFLCLRNQDLRVVKSIVQLGFANDVIKLLMVQSNVQYIRLMAITCQVAPNLRNYFINLGLLQFVMQKFSNSERNSLKPTQLSILLSLIHSLLKTHQLNISTSLKPLKSTIKSLLPILKTQLLSPTSPTSPCTSNLLLTLQSLKQLCLTKKQQIFDYLFQFPQIFQKILDIIGYDPRPEVRLKAVNFLANFMLTEDLGHVRWLVQRRVLEKMYQGFYGVGNRDENRLAVLTFLSNFTADHWEFQQLVLMHPIMQQVIIAQGAYSSNQQIHRESIYCIINILLKLPQLPQSHPQLPTFLQKIHMLKIPQLLITCLRTQNQDPETIKQILELWKEVMIQSEGQEMGVERGIGMEMGREMGREIGMGVYDVLIERFGILEILEDGVFQGELEDYVGEFVRFYCDWRDGAL